MQNTGAKTHWGECENEGCGEQFQTEKTWLEIKDYTEEERKQTASEENRRRWNR